MPKTKQKKEVVISSSDSDSGPEDRNPTPAKKAKSGPSSGPSKSAAPPPERNEWTLEKLRLVKVNEFRGRKMVDIREHYEKNGEILPGKKGISLSLLQWKALMVIADEITAAAEC